MRNTKLKLLCLEGLLLILGLNTLLISPARASDYKVLQYLSGQVVYSPTGQFLLRHENMSLQSWDTNGEHLLRQRTVEHPITDIDFTPDGRFLATGHDDGTYIVWSSKDLKEQTRIQDVSLGVRNQPFALSPDGAYLTLCKIVSTPQELTLILHVWDLRHKRLLKKLFLGKWPNELPGHFPSVELAYHPLGRYLTAAVEWTHSDRPRYLKVWDTWTATWSYWLAGSVPIAYSNDGHYFGFTEYDHQKQKWLVRLWHTPTNLRKQIPFKVAPPPQTDIALSAHGNLIVIASEAQYKTRNITIINTHSLKSILKFETSKSVDSFSFSSDEHYLVLSSRQDPSFKPLRYTLPNATQ